MKYAVVACINGTFSIKSEWSELDKARVNYHSNCSALWNSSDVLEASVAIVDSNLRIVGGYQENIHHEIESGDGD